MRPLSYYQRKDNNDARFEGMRNPRISIVITSHNRPEELKRMVNNMETQTYKPYEIHVLCSGYPQDAPLPVKGIEVPDMNDWGHSKRAHGLSLARGTYVLFANDDDEYSPDFLEKMIRKAQESSADITYCDFTSHLYGGNVVNSFPAHGLITSGNFIVRTKLAKKVGWVHRHYQADWQFVQDCIDAGATFAKVKEVLYVHR